MGSGGPSAGNGSGAQSSNELSIYPCPDSGPAWATVGAGQKFLVTGKTADDAWVRIYWPLPDRDEAWIESGPLKFDGSLAALPVVPCAPDRRRAARRGGAEPYADPGRGQQPLADPVAGGVAQLGPDPRQAGRGARARSRAVPQRYCNDTARSVEFSVRATDTDAIAGVVLYYREPGAAGVRAEADDEGGRLADTWQATLDTDADAISGPGALRYYVSATDAAAVPRSARLPGNGTRSIAVADCTNTGPTLASLKASPATSHTEPAGPVARERRRRRSRSTPPTSTPSSASPFSTGCRATARTAKSMAKSGGVEREGDTPVQTSDRRRRQGLVRHGQSTTRAASSKSSTRTFTVDRCDYRGHFKLSDTTGSPYTCCVGRPRILHRVPTRIGLSTVRRLVYTVRAQGRRDQDREAHAWPRTTTVSVYSRSRQSANSTADLHPRAADDRVTSTTTDNYGGTTKSARTYTHGQSADDEPRRRVPAQGSRCSGVDGRRRVRHQLGRHARAPGHHPAVHGDRRARVPACRRTRHPGRERGAGRLRRPAVRLARAPPEPRAGRPRGSSRQPARRRGAGELPQPVRLPAHPAHHAVRRRAVPGVQLHAHVRRDARPPDIRDRHQRLQAPHAAGRPGGRHRPQRPQHRPVARLRRHAAHRVHQARRAQVAARERLRRRRPG